MCGHVLERDATEDKSGNAIVMKERRVEFKLMCESEAGLQVELMFRRIHHRQVQGVREVHRIASQLGDSGGQYPAAYWHELGESSAP
jgi:hypothetical protein